MWFRQENGNGNGIGNGNGNGFEPSWTGANKARPGNEISAANKIINRVEKKKECGDRTAGTKNKKKKQKKNKEQKRKKGAQQEAARGNWQKQTKSKSERQWATVLHIDCGPETSLQYLSCRSTRSFRLFHFPCYPQHTHPCTHTHTLTSGKSNWFGNPFGQQRMQQRQPEKQS